MIKMQKENLFILCEDSKVAENEKLGYKVVVAPKKAEEKKSSAKK